MMKGTVNFVYTENGNRRWMSRGTLGPILRITAKREITWDKFLTDRSLCSIIPQKLMGYRFVRR